MFRFTTSAVAAVPTPLDTGMTPIPSSNSTRKSSANAATGRSASIGTKRRKTFLMVVSVESFWAANVPRCWNAVGRRWVPGGPKHDSTGLVWAASRHNRKVEPYLVRIDSALGLALPRMAPTLEIVGLALVALLLL